MMSTEKIVFNRPYDDPYRVLAVHIVSNYSPRVIKHVLRSADYVKSMVLQEAKQMDVSGAFLDCIDQEVQAHAHLRGKNACLKKLGEFYYNELDLIRLRTEIRKFAAELGVDIN